LRSDPADYKLVAPGRLDAVLSLLAEEREEWVPIAGGTDVMVQFAAGKLASRQLVSIWNLRELKGIAVASEEVRIGAACTYTEIRQSDVIAREFPLLATAAQWTGGIANQNRGTLGGNIINASPAADSLPALMAYEAEVILVSIRGERRMPYVGFHTGYKTMQLRRDELLKTICIPHRFDGYAQYARKVGARNAQAISKVCIAAVGRISGGVIEDVRIALGSVAAVPLRLTEVERTVQGNPVGPEIIARVPRMVAAAIQPIDDIRSTAKYRTAVASNLVVEFLDKLRASESTP